MTETVAFFSYTRADDIATRGLLSNIRRQLEVTVSQRLGRAIEIFQDTDDIKAGEQWRDKLEKALSQATFLIPIITPSFFQSKPCRDELSRFLRKSDATSEKNLVIPVLFIFLPELNDSDQIQSDSLLNAVLQTQWLDWRKFASQTKVHKALRQSIIHLSDILVARYLEISLSNESSSEVQIISTKISELGKRVSEIEADLRHRKDDLKSLMSDARELGMSSSEIDSLFNSEHGLPCKRRTI